MATDVTSNISSGGNRTTTSGSMQQKEEQNELDDLLDSIRMDLETRTSDDNDHSNGISESYNNTNQQTANSHQRINTTTKSSDQQLESGSSKLKMHSADKSMGIEGIDEKEGMEALKKYGFVESTGATSLLKGTGKVPKSGEVHAEALNRGSSSRRVESTSLRQSSSKQTFSSIQIPSSTNITSKNFESGISRRHQNGNNAILDILENDESSSIGTNGISSILESLGLEQEPHRSRGLNKKRSGASTLESFLDKKGAAIRRKQTVADKALLIQQSKDSRMAEMRAGILFILLVSIFFLVLQMGALSKHEIKIPDRAPPDLAAIPVVQKEVRRIEEETPMTKYLRGGRGTMEHSNPNSISSLLVKGHIPMQDEGPAFRNQMSHSVRTKQDKALGVDRMDHKNNSYMNVLQKQKRQVEETDDMTDI